MTSRGPDFQRIFISDCEGPISKNDNAFELASHFIPDGSHLFTLISRYDDILADIVKREGYKAGDTLKLILPFLKAYSVTDEAMTDFSARNMLLMPSAKEMLEFVKGLMPTYVVSTSYEQYMRALCSILAFPIENVYCTFLNMNKYDIVEEEELQLERLAREMVKLPMLKIPKSIHSLKDLSKTTQRVLQRLDEIFWKEISSMRIGRMLREVNPVGGSEKATVVESIVAKSGAKLQDVMYVGDSITDVSAFQLVRAAGGLTVSFNGNGYAVREAEVAVQSKDAVVTAVLANMFSVLEKPRFIALIRAWAPLTIEKLNLLGSLKRHFLRACRREFPKVALVTEHNIEKLMRESVEFRKNVRGEAVGKLG